MKALIVGASAGLGRVLAEKLAARGADLVLVASDERDLQALASHLRLTHGVRVDCVARAVSAGPGWAREVSEAAMRGAPPDYALFPIGASREDDAPGLPEEAAVDLVGTNFLGIVHLAFALLPAMIEARGGTLVGFGSIAGARGRSRNVVYSAAKSGLRTLFESLRHLGAASGVQVQFYVIGYMDTQQTYGKRLALPVASPQAVADAVVANLGRGSRVAHLPWFWGPVERLLRAMPFTLVSRIKA